MRLVTKVQDMLHRIFVKTDMPEVEKAQSEKLIERSERARERLERNIDIRIRMLEAEAAMRNRGQLDQQ